MRWCYSVNVLLIEEVDIIGEEVIEVVYDKSASLRGKDGWIDTCSILMKPKLIIHTCSRAITNASHIAWQLIMILQQLHTKIS